MTPPAEEERQKLLEAVKRDIRSLLISSKSGLAIQDLYRDYKTLMCSTLPFRELGFDTARQLLLSMPDVCRCQRQMDGDLLITAVADESTAHIEKMVARQKSSQKRRGGKAPVFRCAVRRGGYSYGLQRPQSAASRVFSRSRPTTPSRLPPLVPTRPAAPARPPPLLPTPSPAAAAAAAAAATPSPAAAAAISEEQPEEQPVPEATAGKLAQMLLSYAEHGLPVVEAEATFERETGQRLDWYRLGYRSCAALLLAVPQVVRVVNAAKGLVAYPSRDLLAASKKFDEEEAAAQVAESSAGAALEQRGVPSPAPASSKSGKRCEFLAAVSPVIQGIVEKYPGGLLCSKLVQEYRKQTGQELDVARHGYHSVLDLISKLPVKAIRSACFGDWLLFSQNQPLPDDVFDNKPEHGALLEELPEEQTDRLQETKERIREILLSFPDGLRMNGLEDHYEMNFNERLPLAELGYSSVETFVLRFSGEVLQIRYTDNDIKLFPVLPSTVERPVEEALYPDDVVKPGESFSRVELPDLPLGEYNLEIFVAEVYNPHKFWFHLVGPHHSEAMETVMDDMELVYYTSLGAKYRMTPETVQVGQVCACPYGEQGFHRAVITAVHGIDEPVKVFYVDYGSIGSVPRSDIRFLPERFFQLPAQALLGRLAHILAPAAEGWSRENSQAFLSLVDGNRILYAMIRHKTPTCVHLCLCDTNGGTDVHVNDRLVDLGHAVFREHLTEEANVKEPVEEQSRPVAICPTLPVRLSPPLPSPEGESRRASPQSAIEGLLRETSRADALAAECDLEAEVASELAGAEASVATPERPPVTVAAPCTPPLRPVPCRPPGFSPVSPARAGFAPRPAAPVDSGAALTQMLNTQSALLSNLQMMQLQSMMNPLVNPYAAMLMPTVGALAGQPGVPVGAAQTGDFPVTSAAASLAASAAPEVASGVTSQPRVQEASVCVTSPVQGSSSRKLEETDISAMNQELADMPAQTRFVKRIVVHDAAVHVIHLKGTGHMASAEISQFLWKRDILKTMLRMKNLTLPQCELRVEEHAQLFTELVRYAVPGVLQNGELVDPLMVYPLSTVATIVSTMRNMTEIYDAKACIEEVASQFSPSDPFWSSCVDDDDEDTQSAPAEDGAASSDLSSRPSPRVRRRRLSAASTESGAPPSTVADSAASQLLPEMRSILAQLQSKRRRKVEATALALEGSGISVEDVIGDDLKQIDMQIATFEKRIQALAGDFLSSEASAADVTLTSAASTRRPRTSSVRSMSMNPDAPEFFSSTETSLYVSPDSTVCGADEAAAATPRSAVQVRAADGTPVSLAQLAQKRTPLQLTSPDGKPVQLPQPSPPPPPPQPRRPLDLRTPDGQPVQLSGPAATAAPPSGPAATGGAGVVTVTASSQAKAQCVTLQRPPQPPQPRQAAPQSTWARMPSPPQPVQRQPAPAWAPVPMAAGAAPQPQPRPQQTWAQQPRMQPPAQPWAQPPAQTQPWVQQSAAQPHPWVQQPTAQSQAWVQQPPAQPQAWAQPPRYGMVYPPFQLYQQYAGYPVQYQAAGYPAVSSVQRYPAP